MACDCGGQKCGARCYDWCSSLPALKGQENVEWVPLSRKGFCTFRDCPHTGPCDGPISLIFAMTAYYWDGKGEDPNAPQWMCERHAEEYKTYWQEQWDEYYSTIQF